VGLRASLDIFEWTESLIPSGILTPVHPSRSLVTILTKLSWLYQYVFIVCNIPIVRFSVSFRKSPALHQLNAKCLSILLDYRLL